MTQSVLQREHKAVDREQPKLRYQVEAGPTWTALQFPGRVPGNDRMMEALPQMNAACGFMTDCRFPVALQPVRLSVQIATVGPR